MSNRKIIPAFLFLITLLLYGCKENSIELDTAPTYEETLQEIDTPKVQNDLHSFISFEKKDFNFEDENGIERRLNFRFSIKNLTTENIKISYIGYFPKELETYYLSRSKIKHDAVDLKSNQKLDVSVSTLVALEKSITKEQELFLNNNGHEIYFTISINEKPYFTKVKMDELGSEW